MPLVELASAIAFPDPRRADASGLLAVGGDLTVPRLLAAYRTGIFPWFSRGQPILWWSPDPRFVLPLDAFHMPRSLAKTIRRGTFEVRVDTRFPDVIRACAAADRPDQDGTWITRAMIDAYIRLAADGHAHSFETFADGKLVGGLYGVSLGGAFFGESMFTTMPDASKVALAALVAHLRAEGFALLDCQVHTENLARFGAVEVRRAEFLTRLAAALQQPSRVGRWMAKASAGVAAPGV